MCNGAFDDCMSVTPFTLLAAPITLYWCHTCMSLWVDDEAQDVFHPGAPARPGWEPIYKQAAALLSDWNDEYTLMPTYINETEAQREVPDGTTFWEEALSDDETLEALREEECDRMRQQDYMDYYGYSVGPDGQVRGF